MTSQDEQVRCLADAVAAVKKNAYFMRKATVWRQVDCGSAVLIDIHKTLTHAETFLQEATAAVRWSSCRQLRCAPLMNDTDMPMHRMATT